MYLKLMNEAEGEGSTGGPAVNADDLNPVVEGDDTPENSDIATLFDEDDSDIGYSEEGVEQQETDVVEPVAEDDAEPEVAKPAPAEAPAKPTEQVPAKPETAEVEDPIADLVKQPAKAEEQPVEPTQQDPVDPDEWKKNLSTYLEANVYKISDEDAANLVAEPEKVLPKMLSRLHVDVLEAAVNGIVAQIPRMVDTRIQQMRVSHANKAAFFGRWPELQAHEETVGRLTQMYRQVNPTAPMEQAIEEIGLQAMMMLKLPLDGMQQQPVAETRDPAFTPPPAPAAPGAVSQAPVQRAKNTNVFTELAEDFLDEE